MQARIIYIPQFDCESAEADLLRATASSQPTCLFSFSLLAPLFSFVLRSCSLSLPMAARALPHNWLTHKSQFLTFSVTDKGKGRVM